MYLGVMYSGENENYYVYIEGTRLNLTNRFRFSVRVYCNRSQMTS